MQFLLELRKVLVEKYWLGKIMGVFIGVAKGIVG